MEIEKVKFIKYIVNLKNCSPAKELNEFSKQINKQISNFQDSKNKCHHPLGVTKWPDIQFR